MKAQKYIKKQKEMKTNYKDKKIYINKNFIFFILVSVKSKFTLIICIDL